MSTATSSSSGTTIYTPATTSKSSGSSKSTSRGSTVYTPATTAKYSASIKSASSTTNSSRAPSTVGPKSSTSNKPQKQAAASWGNYPDVFDLAKMKKPYQAYVESVTSSED